MIADLARIRLRLGVVAVRRERRHLDGEGGLSQHVDLVMAEGRGPRFGLRTPGGMEEKIVLHNVTKQPK